MFTSALSHSEGAWNVQTSALVDRMIEINAFRDTSVILVSRMDKHSSSIGSVLHEVWVSEIRPLCGGMEWRKAIGCRPPGSMGHVLKRPQAPGHPLGMPKPRGTR